MHQSLRRTCRNTSCAAPRPTYSGAQVNPAPNPRRSIAPPIISKPKTSAHTLFPPASGLGHMGARRHLPARRSGGSSPGVFHVVGGHGQRPRHSAGPTFRRAARSWIRAPPLRVGTRVRSSSASGRSYSGSSSLTPSTVFCLPALMRANPPAHAAPRLLSLPCCL